MSRVEEKLVKLFLCFVIFGRVKTPHDTSAVDCKYSGYKPQSLVHAKRNQIGGTKK